MARLLTNRALRSGQWAHILQPVRVPKLRARNKRQGLYQTARQPHRARRGTWRQQGSLVGRDRRPSLRQSACRNGDRRYHRCWRGGAVRLADRLRNQRRIHQEARRYPGANDTRRIVAIMSPLYLAHEDCSRQERTRSGRPSTAHSKKPIRFERARAYLSREIPSGRWAAPFSCSIGITLHRQGSDRSRSQELCGSASEQMNAAAVVIEGQGESVQ